MAIEARLNLELKITATGATARDERLDKVLDSVLALAAGLTLVKDVVVATGGGDVAIDLTQVVTGKLLYVSAPAELSAKINGNAAVQFGRLLVMFYDAAITSASASSPAEDECPSADGG